MAVKKKVEYLDVSHYIELNCQVHPSCKACCRLFKLHNITYIVTLHYTNLLKKSCSIKNSTEQPLKMCSLFSIINLQHVLIILPYCDMIYVK